MSVIGKYVASFNQASHALPDGMHMNADYPFMIPVIVRVERRNVTIKGAGGQEATAKIRADERGREHFVLAQSSSFEKAFNRKPTRFRFFPFKDEHTPAIGETTT